MPLCPAGLLLRLVRRRARSPPDPRKRDAPPAVCPGLREAGEVRCLHLLDLKTTLRDEGRNVPCQVTALEHPVMNRLPPLLPPPHARVWGKPVLEKDEPAAGPQDTSDASDGLHHARDR